VKLSRIIPLPTATAIKLELNTRLQLADFTRVQQGGIEKEKREKEEKREGSRSEQFRETTNTDERGAANYRCADGYSSFNEHTESKMARKSLAGDVNVVLTIGFIQIGSVRS